MGKATTEFVSSPEQRQLMQAILPMFQGFGQYGAQRYFGGAPNLGAPSMSGVLTGTPMYDIPDPSMAMPTQNWWNSMSPEVKAGLYAPYQEAGEGMLERMGAQGQVGSPSAGYSGAAGAAMGKLASEAGKNVGLQAWQMTSPMAQMAWGENLARNKQAYGQSVRERMGDYNTAMQAWQMPMGVMSGLGQAMPQGITTMNQNPWAGAAAGGLMGGLSAYNMFGADNLWATAAGAGLGALSGYFS